MHLADAFIQSDLQCIQAIHLSVCVFSGKNQSVVGHHLLPYGEINTVEVNGDQHQLFDYSILQNILFMFSRRNKLIQVKNDMRVS